MDVQMPVVLSGGHIDKTLAPLAEQGANGRQIADASVAIWGAIDAALSPVIGTRGSAALYKRSLHLARSDFPCLEPAYARAMLPGDFSALRAALAEQTGTQAAAAHDAALQTFHNLLAELIGRSLTQRLLHAVWQPFSSGNADQDPHHER